MNTLTKFIDFNLQLHNHSGEQNEGEINRGSKGSRYEVIESETLLNSDLNELQISGSLFSLTTFKNVTFQSCVFYASKIENCQFVNCKFIDCSFQFTEMNYCHLKGTVFVNCKWDLSPCKNNQLDFCGLDNKTSFFLSKYSNEMNACHKIDETKWQREREEEMAAQVEESGVGFLLSQFKKLAA
ncbi:MAG: hypothetical protein HN509_10195 [Halobacteriovoraceae bacterium]|jgi:uncharacterized protein YjbI with pentapeptide repeats|nr:hypothetical protein [Halobacteriovoraceae bacterium]